MSAVPGALCLYRPPSFPLYLPNLQESPIQCTVQYWAAPWYSRPGQHLGSFYNAVWTLMSILCLVVFCWSGSRTALQCNISSFCKTQDILGCLLGSSTCWGHYIPTEAKDTALAWSPGLSPHPCYKEPSPAVVCSAESRCKHVWPLSYSLAFSLNVSGPE